MCPRLNRGSGGPRGHSAHPTAATAPWFVSPAALPPGCGGVLIGPHSALSAAHCASCFAEGDEVLIGSLSHPVSATIRARGICTSPEYARPLPSEGDLMILDLEVSGTAPTPLAFSKDADKRSKVRLYSIENLDGEWRIARSARPFEMVTVSDELLETERWATPSNSGGALVLESEPQLVGILSGRLDGRDVYVHLKSQRGWIERVLASADPRGDGLCAEL